MQFPNEIGKPSGWAKPIEDWGPSAGKAQEIPLWKEPGTVDENRQLVLGTKSRRHLPRKRCRFGFVSVVSSTLWEKLKEPRTRTNLF